MEFDILRMALLKNFPRKDKSAFQVALFICIFVVASGRRQVNRCNVETNSSDNHCTQFRNDLYCRERLVPSRNIHEGLKDYCNGCDLTFCQGRYLVSTVPRLPLQATRVPNDPDVQCLRGDTPNSGKCAWPLHTPINCRGFWFGNQGGGDFNAGPELQTTFTDGNNNRVELKWHMNRQMQINTIKITEGGAVRCGHNVDHRRRIRACTNEDKREYQHYFEKCHETVTDQENLNWDWRAFSTGWNIPNIPMYIFF